jgi:hypothetical protein
VAADEKNGASSVLRGAAAGALGGAVGSSAMILFNHLLASAGVGRDDRGRRKQHRRVDAKPNDADGTISDEPATEKAASNLTELVTGEPLDERGKRVFGPIVHHAFGAAVGALYGAATARAPRLAAGGGLPYGAFVWLAAAEAGLPIVGLSRKPTAYPASRHAASLASHFAFGATVEAVRRMLMRR